MSETAVAESTHTTRSGHDEPSDRAYVGIAILLAVITFAEIGTYYAEEQLGSFLVPVLLVGMAFKFFVVVGWFMHLRFDSNLFTRLFVAGLVLAVVIYLVMLATFEYF